MSWQFNRNVTSKGLAKIRDLKTANLAYLDKSMQAFFLGSFYAQRVTSNLNWLEGLVH